MLYTILCNFFVESFCNKSEFYSKLWERLNINMQKDFSFSKLTLLVFVFTKSGS